MGKINIFDSELMGGVEYRDNLGGHDSSLWIELFVRADRINPDLAQRLMYLRNVGCRLSESEKFGYIIIPIEDYWEQSGVSYQEERKCLEPFRDDVIRLLRGLRK